MLYRGADILILDEPTAVLTPQETDKLFAVLKNMKEDGKAIVIITHKMHEVEAISDRVAVLRKGEYVGSMLTKETNAQKMTNMMVGRSVFLDIERPEPENPRPRIKVENLTVKSMDGILKLDDVSFTANAGEILGIAGISGCGQKELLEAIAGLQKVEAGSVKYINDDGREEELIGKDPMKIADMGVALSFVPEDRLGMGLIASMDLADNMMLRSFRSGKSVFTDRKTPRAFVPSKISSTVSCQRKNNVSTKPKTAIIQAPAAPTAPTNNPSTNWPTLPPQFAQRAAKNTDSKNRSGITTLAFMRFSAFTSKHQIAATKVSIGRIQAARPTRLCSHVEMPFPTAPVNCGKARHMSKNGVTAKSKPNPHRMVFFTVLASLPLN